MDIPCFSCKDYDRQNNRCSLMVQLQALPRDKMTDLLEDLITRRPCALGEHINRSARAELHRRDHNSQDWDDVAAVYQKVYFSLRKMDFRRLKEPNYNNFKPYLKRITKNEVGHVLDEKNGAAVCGNCVYIIEGSKRGSHRCSCPHLAPPPGQQHIYVSAGTKPKDVLHHSILVIGLDDITDWPGFAFRLSREGGRATASPSKRIWELLPEDLREALGNNARNDAVPMAVRLSLIEWLDNLLQRPDFYEETYFTGVTLSREAKKEATKLLNRLKSQNSSNDQRLREALVRRLNRLFLEAAYAEIAKRKRGCSYYRNRLVQLEDLNDCEMRRVGVEELDRIDVVDEDRVKEVLKEMESEGPLQRKQARLLRLHLDGYKPAQIAAELGKERTAVSRGLNGANEGDKEDEESSFHQAGALDVFRARLSKNIAELECANKDLYEVVRRRDFSDDKTDFNKIGRELGISKREAIKRYEQGWKWIRNRWR